MTEQNQEEDNFYQWTVCGHDSTKPGKGLPDRIQIKGYWLEGDKIDLAWYARIDRQPLTIQEQNFSEFIEVIKAGIKAVGISRELKTTLEQWCEEEDDLLVYLERISFDEEHDPPETLQ